MVEWKNINWRKVEKMVFKLQKRIYRARLFVAMLKLSANSKKL